MTQAVLILPHQLFHDNPALKKGRPVFLLEEQLFFGDWRIKTRFHRLVLAWRRASMRAFAQQLRNAGYDVTYIGHQPDQALAPLFDALADAEMSAVHLADPDDFLIHKRLERECAARELSLQLHPSPAFYSTREDAEAILADQKTYNQTAFYRHLRQEHNILMKEGKPAGGKWTYDTDNRKKLPKDVAPLDVPALSTNKAIRQEAIGHISEHYPDNPGDLASIPYPITRDEALVWLEDFCEARLPHFGDYEDAMTTRHATIFHSKLSPCLNAGFLTPGDVLEAVLTAGQRKEISLNNVEGFVRQVLGWREYVRGIYHLEGVRLRTTNHLGHTRPMPQAFYDGSTGLAPLDHIIKKVLRTGYAHHIERLMVLGNAMLLCEIHPDAVYTWFMELFIDATDWVMVPNVYGMSQYADGGLMMTKPYISSSNYIKKMSDYPDGPWCEVWDGLYWRFVQRHRELFDSTPRLSIMPRQLDKLNQERKARIFQKADDFLGALD